MDIRLSLMCGTDIPVPECQLSIHQPKIKEIALIGETDFPAITKPFVEYSPNYKQPKPQTQANIIPPRGAVFFCIVMKFHNLSEPPCNLTGNGVKYILG